MRLVGKDIIALGERIKPNAKFSLSLATSREIEWQCWLLLQYTSIEPITDSCTAAAL